MGKIGGILAAALIATTACTAPASAVEKAPQPAREVTEIRSELTTLHDASDATIHAMTDSICKLYASGKSEVEVTALVIAASAALQIGDDGLKVAREATRTQCPQAR